MTSKSDQVIPNSSSRRDNTTGNWKSVLDQKSGRIYYYNSVTRESTWSKPMELATPIERQEMIRKRNEAIKFFNAMEENIKASFSAPAMSESSDQLFEESKDEDFELDMSMGDIMFAGSPDSNTALRRNTSFNFPTFTPSYNNQLAASCNDSNTIVRTISTIDDDIADILKYDESNKVKSKQNRIQYEGVAVESIPSRRRSINDSINDYSSSQSALNLNATLNESPLKLACETSRVALKRRNSTGTIYVGTTMSVQDNKATIKCVCFVIRAHILESHKRNAYVSPLFDIFVEPPSASPSVAVSRPKIPSLKEIREFFTLIFSKSQLESECIIMALIYCERMIKATNGKFVIRHDNWKALLFACLVMSSKVWDDLSMWNVDFSQLCPSFNLKRVNALELAVLDSLNYFIRVSASEYAKYYFHLRSMMTRLGFDKSTDPSKLIAPLDINGARRLQLATERYQVDCQNVRLSQSLKNNASTESPVIRLERIASADGLCRYLSPHHVTVGLEHIIHTAHNDADGIAHISVKAAKVKSPKPKFFHSTSTSSSALFRSAFNIIPKLSLQISQS